MAERRYTKNGEWVAQEGETYRVGWAASVVEELGEINFVELPKVGRSVTAGEAVCTVEAVKAAADYFAPLGGTVVSVNEKLSPEPALMNSSPEEAAWIFALANVSTEEWKTLLSAEEWAVWESGR